MALDASQSLGAAISLQGTPTDKADKFYEMGIKADVAKAKAGKAAKADKDAAERDRLIKLWKVDPKEYNPLRTEEIKEKLANYTVKLQNYTSRGIDPSSDPEFIRQNAALNLYLQGAKDEAKAMSDDEVFLRNNPTSARRTKNLSPERFVKDSPFYMAGEGVESTKTWQDVAFEQAPKVGTVKIETPNANGSTTILQTAPELNKYYADQFIKKGLNGQDWVAAKLIQDTEAELNTNLAFKELDDKDPNKQMTLLAAATDKYVRALEAAQKKEETLTQKSSTNIYNNMGGKQPYFDPKKGGGTTKTRFGFPTEAAGAEEEISVNGETPKNSTDKESTAIASQTFGDAKLTINLPVNTRDVETGREITTKKSVPITGGSAKARWVFKDGAKIGGGKTILSDNGKKVKINPINVGGLLVPDDMLEQYKKSGLVEAKVMFEGTMDDNGVVTSFYTPASAVLKSYAYLDESGKTNKTYFEDMMSELEKKANEANATLSTKTTATPQQGGQKTIKYKVGNTIYNIPQSDEKEFLKDNPKAVKTN